MVYKNKRGFTLIELLVVIAIIGILSSVVLASLNSARQKSRDARRISDVKQLQLALELYFDSNSQYPAGTALTPLTAGDFIASLPIDPLNSGAYVYTYQARASDGTACSTAPCTGYVIKSTLEQAGHSALTTDEDGSVAGVACGTSGATEVEYCVVP